jgi:outer membrane protein assembly factor BamB
MTVNNTAPAGGATANNVAPSVLTLGGTSGQANLLTGPAPSGANISAGASQDFVWTYQAGTTAGTVNFTGNATGTDANSGVEVSSTSAASNNVTVATLNTEWRYPADATTVGPVRSVPIAYGDNIYFGSDDNNLYLVDSTTHTLNFTYTTSGDIRGMPWPDTESGGKDVVYFGTLGRTVHRYCPSDSGLTWIKDIGTVLTTTSLYDYDPGNAGVYFAADNRNVYRLYGDTGEINWTSGVVVGDDIQSDLSIAPATPAQSYNEIFIGANDGLLYVFSTFDGTLLRDFDPQDFGIERGAIKTALFIAPKDATTHTVFFGTENGKFYALNTSDLSLDSDWVTNPVDIGVAIYSSPWVDIGTRYAYFGCDDGKLYALSMDDGTSKPNFPIDVGSPVQSWPLVANGIVYFGTNDNKFYAVDVETGEIVPGWPYDMGAPIKSGISLQYIDEDNIYVLVGSDAGRIYSFKLVQ